MRVADRNSKHHGSRLGANEVAIRSCRARRRAGSFRETSDVKIAIVGSGAFAQCFIPLFKAHPMVSSVGLADLDAGKLKASAEQFGIETTFNSLDAALESDFEAIALFTQNWLHGPQAAKALKAGKAVYSAVPSAVTVAEVQNLVSAVNETGNIYMIGETSTYYPGAIFCRQKAAEGAFGKIFYSEGEYFHDWDHGLYEVMQNRAGERWREEGGMPPMHYPTHSTGGIISTLGTRATHVSCQGFEDNDEDGIYALGANAYDNRFSNQSALFHLADGGMMRINEFRRVGHPSVERMSMYGAEGCYQNTLAGPIWTDKDGVTRLDDLLGCSRRSRQDDPEAFHEDVAAIHPIDRLPKEFAGLPNGHQGSHQFLADEFVRAVVTGYQPMNNVWQAARYLLPGLIAHQSCVRGGELLPIPDFGDGPDTILPVGTTGRA